MGRLVLLLAAVTAALAIAAPAEAFTRTEHTLTMGDGVSLAATLYRPDGAAPAGGWPAVLLLHGIGENRTSMNVIAEQFFAPQGYVVLTVDARGHGNSGGQSTFVGARETSDYAAALSWLRLRPGVSDTRTGAMGFSLGGGSVWKLLAAPGTRLAAAVPVATWTSLYDALLPQGFAKAGLVSFFRSLLPVDHWDPQVAGLADDALLSRNLPGLRQFTLDRSTRDDLAKIRTPVFMIQGRRDFAFDMDQSLAAFGRLKGKKRLFFGDLGQTPATNPPDERAYYLTQARLWFDRFLKGQLNGIDTRPPIELAPDPWTGKTVQYARQPQRRVLRLRFRGRRTIDGSGKVVRTAAPSKRLNETFGSGLVAAQVSSTTRWPHLVAVLSAIAPNGAETVIGEGGAQTPTLSGNSRWVTIRLTSQATTIRRGSRFRITLGATDSLLYPVSVPSTARVTVGETRVVLPVLRRAISR
ncbi:MAG TPA: CocE/NonD family hydrolase [Gaiellaceae bacterium]|nr:CocE/NonD family hydrolase [Gaiellaceae bacterium]